MLIQAWDFRPGSDFTQAMRDAAAVSERTLAVLSPQFLQSDYAQQELNAAIRQAPLGRKGKLLGLRIAEVNLDPLIEGLVYIDLVGLTENAAREKLLQGIRRERAKPTAKPAFPGERPIAGEI